jgi:hypothetical protein
MLMFRHLMLSALTALAVLVAVAPARADSPGTSGSASARGVSSNYSVYYRSTGTVKWKRYGSYNSGEAAQAAAKRLYNQGYEVQIHATMTLTHGTPSRPSTGTLPTGRTVSYQKAQAVFRWMASQRDIAFHFPADGCYARAHLMIRRMQKNGFHPAKVWSFENGESLYVRTRHHPAGYVTWRYHVAPVLRVRLQGNKQAWYVIDPAMFQSPVTISQWRNAQRRSGSRYQPYITVTRVGQAPIDKNGRRLPGSGYWPGPDPREGLDAHAARVMRAYKPYEDRWPPRKALVSAPVDNTPVFQRANRVAAVAFLTRREMALAA